MFKFYRYILTLAFTLVFFGNIKSQSSRDSAQSIVFIRFEYGHFGTAGDIESRFQNSNAVGGSIEYKTGSNWQIGINASAHFSTKVRSEGLLDNILNSVGDITDSEGELVKVNYEQRGLSVFLQGGKIFPVFGSNANSGIITQFGVGYLRHKIKIDYRDGTVFQLSEENLKGYDRLSDGLAFKQFLGYQYFGKKNLLNFYLGLEFIQGLTVNRRGYNYDTMEYDQNQKQDYLYGFRFGWIIPFRKRAAEEFYFY